MSLISHVSTDAALLATSMNMFGQSGGIDLITTSPRLSCRLCSMSSMMPVLTVACSLSGGVSVRQLCACHFSVLWPQISFPIHLPVMCTSCVKKFELNFLTLNVRKYTLTLELICTKIVYFRFVIIRAAKMND